MCVHISLDTPDQQDIRIILYYYTGYLVTMSSGALRSDWQLRLGLRLGLERNLCGSGECATACNRT